MQLTVRLLTRRKRHQRKAVTAVTAVMKVMNLIPILMSPQHQMTVTRPMTAVVLPVAAAAAQTVAAAQRNLILKESPSQRSTNKWKETFDRLKPWL